MEEFIETMGGSLVRIRTGRLIARLTNDKLDYTTKAPISLRITDGTNSRGIETCGEIGSQVAAARL